MNEDIFKGKAKQLGGKIKETWGKFTDNDITQINGSYEQLEGLLQQKYGYQKEQAKSEINKFLANNNLK